jgi:hypothetical protein
LPRWPVLEKATTVADQFVDMVLAPPLMRALLGEAVAPLLVAASARITATIAMLHANKALKGWS